MKRTVRTGAAVACLGMVALVATAPSARAETAPAPVPTSQANGKSVQLVRPSVHVSIGITRSPRHHVVVPPEIHGGTISLPNISGGPIILPTVKGGTVTLPNVKGGTVTLPDISGGPIVLPKFQGGVVSIPPIALPSLRATGDIRAHGALRGQIGRGNFLAAGGVGVPEDRPVALPKTGA